MNESGSDSMSEKGEKSDSSGSGSGSDRYGSILYFLEHY